MKILHLSSHHLPVVMSAHVYRRQDLQDIRTSKKCHGRAAAEGLNSYAAAGHSTHAAYVDVFVGIRRLYSHPIRGENKIKKSKMKSNENNPGHVQASQEGTTFTSKRCSSCFLSSLDVSSILPKSTVWTFRYGVLIKLRKLSMLPLGFQRPS